MALSSNTLFHFTNSLDVLYKILKEGFWPRYCKETGWLGEGDPLFAVAMVSFCDILLSQIHQHISYYGNYGIGVSKEWALRAHVRPVYYITREMIPFVQKLVGKGSFEKESEEQVQKKMKRNYQQNYRRLLTGMKAYSGWNWKEKMNSDGKIITDYVYYDEREWRFVPENPNEIFFIEVRNRDVDLDSCNQATKKFCIKPELNDIKYLIIRSEQERIEVLKKIDELFNSTMIANDIALLKSKILTCEQIKEDF